MKKKVKQTYLDKPILYRDPSYKQKVLLFDIETRPNLSYVWGVWEQDVLEVKEHWNIISYSYKWLGESQTYVVALPDFKNTYKKDPNDDSELVRSIWELFNQAEIVIGHNSEKFDTKKANARFVQQGLEPPMPYKQIDTLRLARRYFKFDSNKLDSLGDYLKVGRKIHHTGFNLWLGCMNGDMKAWDLMKKYNKQDVILLEKIYYKLRSWDKSAPNMNLILGGFHNCPTCGSQYVKNNGIVTTRTSAYEQYKCLNCGSFSRGEKIKNGFILR